MTKQIFTSKVTREGDVWATTTFLPEIGKIQAETPFDHEIEWHTRCNICSFTDLKPFDFEIHFEFSGDAPVYYLD